MVKDYIDVIDAQDTGSIEEELRRVVSHHVKAAVKNAIAEHPDHDVTALGGSITKRLVSPLLSTIFKVQHDDDFIRSRDGRRNHQAKKQRRSQRWGQNQNRRELMEEMLMVLRLNQANSELVDKVEEHLGRPDWRKKV